MSWNNVGRSFLSAAFCLFTAAFDTVCGNIESVVQTYRNVKYAMQYRLVRGLNCQIQYTDLISSIDKNYEYPAKIEKAIIREINLKTKSRSAQRSIIL